MRLAETSRRRAGFTLVEALVVTAIIAILVGMTTSAVTQGLRSAEDAKVLVEIKQLENGVNAFRANFGVDYLPSQFVLKTRLTDYNDANPIDRECWQYLTTLWPRLSKTVLVNNAPQPAYVNWAQIPNFSNQAQVYQLNGSQCAAFFLGGARFQNAVGVSGYIGFAPNQQNPMAQSVSTSQVRVGPFYEFTESRLIGNAPGQFPVYGDAYQKGVPYAYFSAYKTGYRQERFIPTADPTLYVAPYCEPSPTNPTATRGLNAQSFQIICAGRDGVFGSIRASNPNQFYFIDWKNGSYFPNPGKYSFPNPRASQDDLANFHPTKLSIPQ